MSNDTQVVDPPDNGTPNPADPPADPPAGQGDQDGADGGGDEGADDPPKPTVHDARNAIIAKAAASRAAENAADPDRVAIMEAMAGRGPGGAAAPDPDEGSKEGADDGSKKALALNGGTVKLKVDGNEVEVPQEQVLEAGVRTLQKEATADLKLQRASTAETLAAQHLADAARIRAEAESGLPSGARRDTPDDPPSGDTSGHDAIADAAVAQVQEALFDGDTGKAKSALLDASRKMSQAATRAEVVVATNDSFVTDFPDIAADPEFFGKAAARMRAELGKNPTVGSIPVIASRIGMQIRSEMLRKLDPPADPPPDPANNNGAPRSRADVKVRLPAMPSRASTRVESSRKPDPPPQTRKEIVQQMRERRGQVRTG